MRKFLMISSVMIMALMLVGCGKTQTGPQENPTPSGEIENNNEEKTQLAEPEVETKTENTITAEKAYDGVDKYCHENYEWNTAEENSDSMYVQMGEETDTEYQVIFRSYTGAFIHFYVDKTTGITRIVEISPIDNIASETGTINLSDYLN